MIHVKFSLKERYIPRWLYNLIAIKLDLCFIVIAIDRNKMQTAFNQVVAPKDEYLANVINFTKRGALTFRFESEKEKDDFIKYWGDQATPETPLSVRHKIE
jgi:hypothetical protein